MLVGGFEKTQVAMGAKSEVWNCFFALKTEKLSVCNSIVLFFSPLDLPEVSATHRPGALPGNSATYIMVQ